jgi:hypothetical protein
MPIWPRCHAISAFYKRELQCGDGSVAHLVERSPGVFLLSVHVKDMAMLRRLEFEGAILKRRVGNPNIHMVLVWCARWCGAVQSISICWSRPSPSMCCA